MSSRLVIVLALVSSVYGQQCNNQNDKLIGDLCYSISNQQLNFHAAQTACYRKYQNLAVIHNTMQANFLASMVGYQTGVHDGTFWIGLSRPSTASRFQWDDGTSLAWSNFDQSLPKNALYVAESITSGKWQTLEDQELYFVCSYFPGGVTSGWPVSTEKPASVPVSGATGYPVSVPVSGATGYPASVPVSGATGYPASVPASRATGYPASVPVSGATGYPASVPASGATGYPASILASRATRGYPASGAPVSYPAKVAA
uniref:C-type lectin domain-containing protein n=1 Tax=Caenorhabditis tropicalis TaxID=1561998 RepID=A0A1I7TQ04_9PELO